MAGTARGVLKLSEYTKSSLPTVGRMVEGQITEVLASGLVVATTDAGDRMEVRCPQHVSPAWLKAALGAGPVDAVLVVRDRRPAIVWCVFPRDAHDEAAASAAEPVIQGRRVVVRAKETIHLECGPSLVVLNGSGEVRTRGKDILSRASRVNRIKGASVRIN